MSIELFSALSLGRQHEHDVACVDSAATSLNGAIEDPFEDGEDDDDELQLPERLTKNGRRRALSFPLKLLKVLSMKMYTGIVEWTPSGKAFKVLDTDRFESEVMATHFKSAKYSSFLRKLRRWGYARLYRGPDSGAYYHRQFSRDHVENVMNMVCLKREPSKKPQKLERPTTARKPVSRAFSQLPVVSRESSFASSNQVHAASMPSFRQVPRQNEVFPTQVQYQRPVPSSFNALFELEVSRRVQERMNMEASNNINPVMSSLMRTQARTSLNEQLGLNQHLAMLYSQAGLASKLVQQAPPSPSPEMDQYLPMLATIFGAKTA